MAGRLQLAVDKDLDDSAVVEGTVFDTVVGALVADVRIQLVLDWVARRGCTAVAEDNSSL